jgi:hypothetical protein
MTKAMKKATKNSGDIRKRANPMAATANTTATNTFQNTMMNARIASVTRIFILVSSLQLRFGAGVLLVCKPLINA